MSDSTILFSLKDVAYGPSLHDVLATGISIELKAGQVLLVRGPNGSGKTTLLRLLLGQSKPIFGEVKVRAAGIGYLPQLETLELHLPFTLGDAIALAPGFRSFADALALGLVEESSLRRGWNTASGGERKRTLLTRILLSKPGLLILDEPMNHLDSDSRSRVAAALAAYVKSGDRGVVLVSHEGLLAAEKEAFQLVELALKGRPGRACGRTA